MDDNRRSFIQSGIAGMAGMAGVAGIAGMAGGAGMASAAPVTGAGTASAADLPPAPGTASPVPRHPQPLPTGLTFATLRKPHGPSLGIRDGERVLDVAAAEARFKLGAPVSIEAVLHGRGDLGALPALLAKARSADAGLFLAVADAPFGPCVTAPEKIICVGLNYKAHVAEASLKQSTVPILFNKFNSALNHHRGEIAVSKEKVARKFDYEGELVVVMGRTARDVSEADALSYVFGYCTGNDFSARDLQLETSQWMEGKTGDGWGPIGPWLVTADQVDPTNLDLETRVNGEVRQSANTRDMIFDCKTLVSFASHRMTLRPGDLIFTGTPQGVILGYPPEKQVWLKAGDRITTRIGNLGELDFTLT